MIFVLCMVAPSVTLEIGVGLRGLGGNGFPSVGLWSRVYVCIIIIIFFGGGKSNIDR